MEKYQWLKQHVDELIPLPIPKERMFASEGISA
jgi:hypothetical protein